MRVSNMVRSSRIVFYGSLGPLRNRELLCDCHQLLVQAQVNGNIHQSNSDLVRYLDRSIVLSMFEVLHMHVGACLSTRFFVDPMLRRKLRESLSRHAQCWGEEKFDPSVAVAEVKKGLAQEAALDRVEAAWSSLVKYFNILVAVFTVVWYVLSRCN